MSCKRGYGKDVSCDQEKQKKSLEKRSRDKKSFYCSKKRKGILFKGREDTICYMA